MFALKSVITCKICQKIYHTPRRMPDGNCGHVFCTDCIGKMSESDKGLVTCPECSLSQTLPDGGATSLQLDASMERIISSLRCDDCGELDPNAHRCDHCSVTTCISCNPLHQIPQKCRTLALVRLIKNQISDEIIRQKLVDKKQQWENIIPLLDKKRELLTAEYTKLIETLEIHKKSVHSLMEEMTRAANSHKKVYEDVVVITEFAEATRHHLTDNDDLANVASIETHCTKMVQELDKIAACEVEYADECISTVNTFINKVKWCRTFLTAECTSVDTQTNNTPLPDVATQTIVHAVDASVQYPPYLAMRANRVIDTAQHVPDLITIYTTATCPVTGRLYVCGVREDKRVFLLAYNQDIQLIEVITTDVQIGRKAPFISVSPVGELLITHGDSNEITILDSENRQLRKLATSAICQDTISVGNMVYVCLVANDPARVSVYDEHGTLVRDIGSNVLKRPWYIAMDASKRLYVSDVQTRSIHVFTSGGDPIRQITTAGNGAKMAPRGVHVDVTGYLLVTDQENNCVHVFSTEGTWLHTLRDDRIKMAEGLTLTSRREIILVDRTKKSFLVFE